MALAVIAYVLKMSFTALPNDCLLACSRAPYADLRNAIPGTCKSMRDAVASAAFRKTREAGGCTEWAVFASNRLDRTASSSRRRPRAARRRVHQSLSAGSRSVSGTRSSRWERTRSSAPPGLTRGKIAGGKLRHRLVGHKFSDPLTCLMLGARSRCLSGEDGRMIDRHGAVYRRLPRCVVAWAAFPSELASVFDAKAVEANGKLWLYAVDYEHVQETFIYDPEARTWTPGLAFLMSFAVRVPLREEFIGTSRHSSCGNASV